MGDIGAYDDTKLSFFSAQLKYLFGDEAWQLGIGGFFEDYELGDLPTSLGVNYLRGGFLNANNGNYQAWAGWINLTY